MKNLKNKVIQEGKRFGASLIPFGFLTKTNRKIVYDTPNKMIYQMTKTDWMHAILSAFSTSILLCVPTLYSIGAINQGDINYKHWSKIQEERRVQEQLSYQNSLRQEFKLLDQNNDAVIDSTEFIYRK